MGNYSAKEIAAFKKKDAMIVSQSSLDRATQIVLGLGASGLDPFTLANVKKRITETAEELSLWVYVNADTLTNAKGAKSISKDLSEPDNKSPTKSLPTPTPDQDKVLKVITKQLFDSGKVWDIDYIHQLVLNYSIKVAGMSTATYPKSLASVDKICNWIKGD